MTVMPIPGGVLFPDGVVNANGEKIGLHLYNDWCVRFVFRQRFLVPISIIMSARVLWLMSCLCHAKFPTSSLLKRVIIVTAPLWVKRVS